MSLDRKQALPFCLGKPSPDLLFIVRMTSWGRNMSWTKVRFFDVIALYPDFFPHVGWPPQGLPSVHIPKDRVGFLCVFPCNEVILTLWPTRVMGPPPPPDLFAARSLATVTVMVTILEVCRDLSHPSQLTLPASPAPPTLRIWLFFLKSFPKQPDKSEDGRIFFFFGSLDKRFFSFFCLHPRSAETS